MSFPSCHLIEQYHIPPEENKPFDKVHRHKNEVHISSENQAEIENLEKLLKEFAGISQSVLLPPTQYIYKPEFILMVKFETLSPVHRKLIDLGFAR